MEAIANIRDPTQLLGMASFSVLCTPSGLFYLAQVRMTRSPRLHFDHPFALYYIIHAYKLIIIG
jgi:hypothetical protein